MGLFRTTTWLPDHLPWAGLIAPGVVCTTSGALLASFAVRGPDVDSYTEGMLLARAEQLNHLFQRYGKGWALHWEAKRTLATTYPERTWPTLPGWLIDLERGAQYADGQEHFETTSTLTLIMQSSKDRAQTFMRHLYETSGEETPQDYHRVVQGFLDEVEALHGLLTALFLDVHRLDDAGLLTYLHSCCSTKTHPVAVPRYPVFLSHVLADQPFIGGEQPRLGEHHLRVLSIKTWPHGLYPGILGHLDHLGMEYRLSLRWLPLDKDGAIALTHKNQRNWLQQRKGLLTLLREQLMKTESPMQNPEADTKARDAVEAQAAVAEGLIGFGYLTLHLVLWDTQRDVLEEKVRLAERTLNGEGFVTMLETQHSVEAWLATMPGNLYECLRTPLLSTNNLVDLAPTTSIWSGPTWNDHFNAPVLCYGTTGDSTPFRISLHDGDVAHALLIGPPGSGKDTALWFFAAQFTGYHDAQVFVFDKGHGSRCMTAAMRGTYEALIGDDARPAQPLAFIDQHPERVWAAGWIEDLVVQANIPMTPTIQTLIWDALDSLAEAPQEQRTFTTLTLVLQDETLREVIKKYTFEGPYGMLLDGDSEDVNTSWWQVIAMDKLLAMPDALPAVLAYRFHRIEQRLDGRPTMIILNEFGEYVDHPVIVKRVQSWLTQLRKLNAGVILASQNIQHFLHPLLKNAGTDIPTRIYLANLHACEEETAKLYQAWGLNERQRWLIATMTPKKEYYLVNRFGARKFDLKLGPLALAYGASGSAEDLRKIAQMSQESPETFALDWLTVKGIDPAIIANARNFKEMTRV